MRSIHLILKSVLFGVIALTVGALANLEHYSQAIKDYDSKKYNKAFPIILEEANKGVNKDAQYRLAQMYENGLGTEVNYKKSTYWYKQAASKYAIISTTKIIEKDSSFMTRLDSQFSDDNINDANEFTLAKLDTNTLETKSLISSFVDGDFFGLSPYNVNYLLPFSYSKEKPNRVDSIYGHNGLPEQYKQYGKHTEVVFQVSLKKQLSYNLFGLNESIFGAYTQKVWWQLYDESAPFRETNYQPEVFMMIPTSESIDDSIGLKSLKLGFLHESNGQEGYRSRSWNRLYATGLWQWDNLFLATRVWYRLEEDKNPDWYYEQSVSDPDLIRQYSGGDDNPDIQDYLGYGDIKLSYLYKKSKFGLLLRNNLDFDENKGAIEFSYSHPLFDSTNTFWYTKIFTGYGESLIDYNVNVTKVSFGFSFSRELF